MKVVILCGGKGVRYNIDKPKSLAMIGDKPIIRHLMDIYSQQGFNEFILCLGWKQEDIIDYFSKAEHKYKITFVDTGQESHTAKRLKLIEQYIPKEDENLFCTYADGLSNIDLTKLQARHLANKNIATLTAVRPINQFGVLVFDKSENIVRFEEKPKMIQYINGGFFIFNKKIFDYIDVNKNQELEKDILTELAYNNELGSYKHEGFWETLNTPKDEIMLNELYRKRTLYSQINY
jgi:glucose-1-phosphate cytidylyltransferase